MLRLVSKPIISSLIIISAFHSPLYSQISEKVASKKSDVRVSIGATVWYAWWRPPWEDIQFSRILPWKSAVEVKPNFLGGPIFSLTLSDKWNISAAFIYGKFRTEKEIEGILQLLKFLEMKAEAQRFDLDFTVNYNVHKYVKLFGGVKYQGYRASLKMIWERDLQQDQAGPGLGIGLILPIVSTFYFLPNASGVVMGGKLGESTIVSAGFNATASFAYFIEVIRTTVALGGRYQYMKYIVNENALALRDNDQFYGITLSVTYTF